MFAAQAQLVRVVAALRCCVVCRGGQPGVAASLCAGWQAGDWVGLVGGCGFAGVVAGRLVIIGLVMCGGCQVQCCMSH